MNWGCNMKKKASTIQELKKELHKKFIQQGGRVSVETTHVYGKTINVRNAKAIQLLAKELGLEINISFLRGSVYVARCFGRVCGTRSFITTIYFLHKKGE